MSARRALVLLAFAAGACDHSGDAPSSTFAALDPLSGEVSGRVHRGPALVEGAIVRIAASPGSSEGAALQGGDLATDATNAFGFYRFTNAPRQYDLAIRLGRDVVVYRDLLPRYVEPSFGSDAVPRAFAAKVVLTVDPPLQSGRELALFVSGDDAVGVTGDLAGGLTVALRQFSAVGTQPNAPALHVVEHEAGAPLASAIAYGSAPLVVGADRITPVTVHLAPIAGAATPTTITAITARGWDGAGAQVSDVEIAMHFGVRGASRGVAVTRAGLPIRVVAVPNATYTMRVRAARGAARSDSGLQAFYPTAEKLDIELPAPPRTEGLDAGALVADGEGVREHRLVPLRAGDDGVTVRAVTTSRAVLLAELARVGAAPAPGPYTWTVQHWPKLRESHDLGGSDARAVQGSATSEPVIVTVP